MGAGWNALETANITAALALVVAIIWRFRDHAWYAAGALGVGLSVKLLLWLLLVWLECTRPLRTAGLAVAAAISLALLSWAVIGFAGLTSFREQLAEIEFEESYSVVGLTASLELEPWVGRLATAVLGAALLVALGVARPRFSPIWLLPIVLWVCPRAGNGDGLQPFLPALVVALLLAVFVARPDGARRGDEAVRSEAVGLGVSSR